MRIPSSFMGDVEDGFTSNDFNLSDNIVTGDARGGLDEAGKREVKKIMKKQKLGFDEARKVYTERRFAKNNIGPEVIHIDPALQQAGNKLMGVGHSKRPQVRVVFLRYCFLSLLPEISIKIHQPIFAAAPPRLSDRLLNAHTIQDPWTSSHGSRAISGCHYRLFIGGIGGKFGGMPAGGARPGKFVCCDMLKPGGNMP